ncbi:hypothetical protein DMUE_0692 [Dictyocoela muelleri]|nr:hypothetical protein DMUE_0692 [Dictyocoela muelleri]
MRPYKNLTEIGAPELGKHIRNEKTAFNILKRLKVLPEQKFCDLCKKKMRCFGHEKGYFYCDQICRNRLPIRNGTILDNNQITFKKFIILCHYYFHKTLVTKNLFRE